jgi:outer membrane protein assembly factor BamB
MWTWPSELGGEGTNAAITAPVAVLNGRLYVPLAAPAEGAPGPGLVCFSLAAGTADGPGKPLWHYSLSNGVALSPAVAGEDVYVVDGRPGLAGRALHCLDAEQGQRRWTYPLAAGAPGGFSVAGVKAALVNLAHPRVGRGVPSEPLHEPAHAPPGGTDASPTEQQQDATVPLILLAAGPQALVCLSTGGGVIWEDSLPGRPVRSATISAPYAFAATAGENALIAMDLFTGRRLWSVPLAAAPVTAPVCADAVTLLVGTERGLEVFSLVDGRPLPAAEWPVAGGAVGGDMVVRRDFIACINRAGELVFVDRRGSPPVLRRIPGAMPGTSPLAGGETVLYVGADGGMLKLQSTDAEAKSAEWLADTAALGKPDSPAVLSGTSLYMAWRGWGLVCIGGMKNE